MIIIFSQGQRKRKERKKIQLFSSIYLPSIEVIWLPIWAQKKIKCCFVLIPFLPRQYFSLLVDIQLSMP